MIENFKLVEASKERRLGERYLPKMKVLWEIRFPFYYKIYISTFKQLTSIPNRIH